ncbi:pyrimidine utilization protein D [Ramlibacter sp. H39-3-26]|uniref:pyrimidine utilization protein D n=1 Tax=Curvibacter soli TaxID=3031331 RepID=UPI0023D9CA81|nr:pyrimidine utilization protein D [Ramlibacter sp. H39-3-26]MDF1485616.1 pyrimidine utilization protein D [Ramlibacter sp. H39-3-26]
MAATTLAFDIYGPPEAAHTVLLSSGLGGSAGFWKPQIPALAEVGLRVIAYDQRGTGRSPGLLPSPYSIDHMAQDVAEILDATHTARCHLVGHALGGLVGLQLALDAPERIASLALVNAWSMPNPHSARCFDTRLSLLGLGGQRGVRAYVEAQPIFLYPAAWCAAHAQHVADEVRHAFAHFPGEATMRSRIAALRAFDVDARLGDIAAPTLVMTAMDDTLVPWTMSQRLAQRLPNAALERVPHGGHAHSVTEAEPFNQALLAFLAVQAKTVARP